METNRNVVIANPPSPSHRKFMRTFDCSTESKGHYFYQPYDALMISAKIPQEVGVIVVDAIADELSEKAFIESLSQASPHIVIYAMGDSLWEDDYKTLRKLQELLPETKFYVYGDSFQDRNLFEKFESKVDGILKSPWDLSPNLFLGDLASDQLGLKRGKDFNYKKKPELKFQGIPRHELFLNKAYRWPFARSRKYTTVFINWGCAYSCSYCILSSFPFYHRSHDDVIAELEYVKKLGIREVYFGDRSFGLPVNLTKEILKTMIEKNYRFSWSCYFHPNQFEDELLELMKKSGCHTIITGIESRDLNLLRKHHRHIQKGELEKLVTTCQKLGIDICGDFIIGLPDQSEEEVLSSIDYAIELDLAYVSFNIATPLAGTSIREEAVSNNLISQSERGFNSLGSEQILPTKYFSKDKILELKSVSTRKFYLRPHYLFRRMLKIKSFEHLLIQVQEAIGVLTK